jgi:hypothetical protein
MFALALGLPSARACFLAARQLGGIGRAFKNAAGGVCCGFLHASQEIPVEWLHLLVLGGRKGGPGRALRGAGEGPRGPKGGPGGPQGGPGRAPGGAGEGPKGGRGGPQQGPGRAP